MYSKNLVYLSKNRIVSIDRILPVLMEIKKINPEIRPVIVLWNKAHYDVIKSNHTLWDGLRAVNSRIYAVRGANKFLTFVNLLNLICLLSFKDNIILKDADVLPLHGMVMAALKKISRVTQIKVYLSVQFASYLKNIYIQSILYRERAGLPTDLEVTGGEYDYFMSALTREQWKEAFNIDLAGRKMVKTGYVYKLPEWDRFRKKAVEKNEATKGDYFFYILHATYQRRSLHNEPDIADLIEESLRALKKYNHQIRTVFKPHPVTDLAKIGEIIDRVGYTNYVIDYSHPMVLSSNAKFVFANVFSSVMFMAYYLGKPTVEYAQYDPELLRRLGGQSLGGRFCDIFIHRNAAKLDETLSELIDGEIEVRRDPGFMRDNYPDSPPQFYEFLHKLFS